MLQLMILIIDAMNLFIRSYAAFPSVGINGQQTGGIVGSLRTINKLIKDLSPDKCLIVFESGGSKTRRKLLETYKRGNKPENLNRFYEQDEIPDTEENRKHQLIALINLLKETCIQRIYVENAEADDVIAYLCKSKFYDQEKIIVSNDKDFYQLLDDKTKIYSLNKKMILGSNDILKEYNISASNFALAKSVCGDASDNIDGIQGCGFKTLAKRFPFLAGEQDILIEDLINYAAANKNLPLKIYKNIFEGSETIKRNWKLIYLGTTILSQEQIKKINRLIENFDYKPNKINFIKKLLEEGINDFDVHEFFATLNRLRNN